MSDCIEWQGGRYSSGYGRIGSDYAHRVVMRELHAPIEGMSVMHHCDNPPCINPEHLTVGTHAENMADAARKGRMWKAPMPGESHPMHILTEQDVRQIRADGRPHKVVAAEYGVAYATVWDIRNHRSWRHLT